MPFYVVTYEHPEEDGWRKHLMTHVAWLRARLADGALIASGPFAEGSVKSAMLIIDAADHDALAGIIAGDPYAEHGLIANMSVRAWDPIFGAFNDRSSMPAASAGS